MMCVFEQEMTMAKEKKKKIASECILLLYFNMMAF